MGKTRRFRVVTYNIHKCRGMDRRVRPERIVKVLREIDADIVALQEVLWIHGAENTEDQAHFIARELGLDFRLGENRKLHGAAYGNVVLSRFPMSAARNHDISVSGREQRGCLRVDIDLPGKQSLHIYNVHLGTSYSERHHQARKLLNQEILKNGDHAGPRLLLGDFNDWTRGPASRLLAEHFRSADMRIYIRRFATYPGFLPFIHLDHIYFDESLVLVNAFLQRGRTALLASDHLPVVAEFRL
jgi:endonuclease/exonuclease/phosphatase family metal-dependent hydrolase